MRKEKGWARYHAAHFVMGRGSGKGTLADPAVTHRERESYDGVQASSWGKAWHVYGSIPWCVDPNRKPSRV